MAVAPGVEAGVEGQLVVLVVVWAGVAAVVDAGAPALSRWSGWQQRFGTPWLVSLESTRGTIVAAHVFLHQHQHHRTRGCCEGNQDIDGLSPRDCHCRSCNMVGEGEGEVAGGS